MTAPYYTLKDIDLLEWLKGHSTPDELDEFDRAVSQGRQLRLAQRHSAIDQLTVDRPHDFRFPENQEEATKEIV